MISSLLSRIYILVFGILYPSYSSYKAIMRKDVREYTRWMMYWVSFGIFSATEYFTDIFLAFWFPFYYELKILFILWLMSPYCNGAKIFYKKIVHPQLVKREEIIDSYIDRAAVVGFLCLKYLGRKISESFNMALSYSLQTVKTEQPEIHDVPVDEVVEVDVEVEAVTTTTKSSRPRRAAADRARGRFRKLKGST